ncbi:ABC transporter substrate-binding protein [Candidatus Methanocrinis natronophilus]|uniref:ABC transporter substrate-binding protein n=1 Tax=Candidatus Methanocrinis natronophilus TaxID=3033396 RepID=A0ABT5XB16_9EURY|nr:ABC transporter substrate-binding protein [Candidatus Methanocrinis natronophilus]MDF0591888.1 ABC transporter substrate-binding protein [Candidatus Methanocrinis natronophilus]
MSIGSAMAVDYPLTVTDSAGRSVTIAGPVEKIVVMNSDAADAVSILGDVEKIAGSVDIPYKAHYFAEFIDGWEIVGTWREFNYEKIAELAKDDSGAIAIGTLVICYANKAVEMEESLGAFEKIDVLGLDLYNAETLEHEMTILGTVLDRKSEAEAYNAWVREKMASVEDSVSGVTRPKVYVETGPAGDIGSLATVSRGSALNELISLAGGDNIIDVDQELPKVEWELVLTGNPDVIIKVPPAINRLGWADTSDMEALLADIRGRPGASTITAVADGRAHVIFRDITLGTGAVVGLTYFAKIIHPEIDLDPVGVYQEYLAMRGLSYPEGAFIVLPGI